MSPGRLRVHWPGLSRRWTADDWQGCRHVSSPSTSDDCSPPVIAVPSAAVCDFAVITTLARLGLRAAEVATLRLDDVHWRVGELVVQGKGRRAHIVAVAAQRAGLGHVSAHQLRHFAATQLLRAGAPLSEIQDFLRHARMQTTAIYAKVDRDALRTIARPWPGGVA